MTRKRPSFLARRVTWAVTGTAAVFLTIIGLLAYETFARMEDDLVDEVLSGQIAALRDELGAGLAVPAVLPPRWSEGGRVQAGAGSRVRTTVVPTAMTGILSARAWSMVCCASGEIA